MGARLGGSRAASGVIRAPGGHTALAGDRERPQESEPSLAGYGAGGGDRLRWNGRPAGSRKSTVPVRHFFDERFSAGLREVQRRYRQSSTALSVPPGQANPGTVGTAADWMLRFLAQPQPDLYVAVAGAVISERAGIHVCQPWSSSRSHWGSRCQRPQPRRKASQARSRATVPIRICWPAMLGPGPDIRSVPRWVGRCLDGTAKPVPSRCGQQGRPALDRPSRCVRPARRIPACLRDRSPSRAREQDRTVGARADRRRIRTHESRRRCSRRRAAPRSEDVGEAVLAGVDLFQVIGYTHFDDDYQIDSLAIFTARYGHLATWHIHSLLRELAGGAVNLPAARAEFRQLLLGGQTPHSRTQLQRRPVGLRKSDEPVKLSPASSTICPGRPVVSCFSLNVQVVLALRRYDVKERAGCGRL